jgi:flagellar motor switch protein FliM
LASIVLPADIVIVVTLGIEFGSSVGDIHLCLPYAMLEPIRNRLQVSFQNDVSGVDHAWIKRFSNRLKNAPVNISVILGETEISVDEFMHFAPGDVITLNKSTTQPLIATVEGMPKFTGFPGTTKGMQSFQIQDILVMTE